ncbi:unnamed protein product [Owenia fusiformis]|uniref:5'-AMP-activated protein kinase subunit beta-1 n=1 Tax=Owenia fusiformis TaxID=6347 RepID=A0A8J1Y4W6_OWEFU|nr:unnamed protein product [Owenia fusiformis]
MGNTQGGTQKRHSSGDDTAPSMLGIGGEDDSFTRRNRIIYQPPSLDDQDTLSPGVLTAMEISDADFEPFARPRASTITSHADIQPTKLPTVFKWEGGGKDVYLSGSYDGWKTKIPMVKSHGDFYQILELPEGDHQYKFYVDGAWKHDNTRPLIPNNLGSHNNLINVKQSDFEVFEALAVDSSAAEKKMTLSGSPPGDYNQIIPQRRPDHKHTGPPILPPHLLQVILNKDTPAHCEPTLLPEPNHVMLNHLYALSIKDGVMVLSATHRYRKKYVTTLLYKPI